MAMYACVHCGTNVKISTIPKSKTCPACREKIRAEKARQKEKEKNIKVCKTCGKVYNKLDHSESTNFTCGPCKQKAREAKELEAEFRVFNMQHRQERWAINFLNRVDSEVKYYESGEGLKKSKNFYLFYDTVEKYVFYMIKESHSDTRRYDTPESPEFMSHELKLALEKDPKLKPCGEHPNGMVTTIKFLGTGAVRKYITNPQQVISALDKYSFTISTTSDLNSNELKEEQNKPDPITVETYYTTCGGMWHIPTNRFLSLQEFDDMVRDRFIANFVAY